MFFTIVTRGIGASSPFPHLFYPVLHCILNDSCAVVKLLWLFRCRTHTSCYSTAAAILAKLLLLLLCASVNFIGFVSFLTATLDQFHFQSRKWSAQSNVKISIRFKVIFFAFFIHWVSRTNFLLVGRQDIVNYWDFPPRLPEATTKGLYRNLLDMIKEKCL